MRIAFAEGSTGIESAIYRAAVMMTVEDAIGLAESIFRSAGGRVERMPIEEATKDAGGTT